MRSLAIFNGKGGVGKSTLTLFLADFISTLHVKVRNRPARVLVLDLDGQNSSASALMGRSRVDRLQAEGRSIGSLLAALIRGAEVDIDDYLLTRVEGVTEGRKKRLAELHTLVSEDDATFALEQSKGSKLLDAVVTRLGPLLARRFDIVLCDFPANMKPHDHLAMAALASAQNIVVPLQPTQMVLNTMDRTFKTIEAARALARASSLTPPRIAGIALNMTNKTYKQYKDHQGEIEALATRNRTIIFDHALPPAPALANASDDSLSFAVIRDKYDTHYDHVRKLTQEIAVRCGWTRGPGPR